MTRRSWMLASPALLVANPGPAPARLSLDSLNWLAGRWQGQMPWGAIEEVWAPAAEGVMMGMFRMSSRGRPSLFEFMTLEQKGEGVCLKIRHFNGAFVAREEKDRPVVFDVTDTGDASFTFFADEGKATVKLVYHRTSADAMEVAFEKTPVEGKPEKIRFPYRRAT